MKLIVPSVHNNGTGKESLLQALEDAHEAINAAYEKLRLTCPNGRDYYVYKDNPYERARKEWRSRMMRLQSVMEELEAIADGINMLEMEVDCLDRSHELTNA